MGIGKRVQIQLVQLQVIKDSDGRNREGEGDKFGVWAEVSNQSGSRGYLNGQTQLSNTRTFLTRFRFDKVPDANWKIRYDGKDWTISDIRKRDEKKFYWQITASAKYDK